MSQTLSALAHEIATKRKNLATLFDEHKNSDGQYTLTEEQCVEVRSRTAELDTLCTRHQTMVDARKALEDNAAALAGGSTMPPAVVGLPGSGASRKSLGQLIVESKAFTGYVPGSGVGPVAAIPYDAKAVLSTTEGWDPEDIRRPGVLLSAQQQPRVLDLVPRTTTNQSTVLYMEETTFINAAAETAEDGTYGEATIQFTERSSEVRKIAVFLPVTDEQLEDVPRIAALIDTRLRFMLMKRADSQMLVGDGVAPNLTGVNNLAGILTQPLGADPVFDAFYKALTQIAVNGFADADGIVIHNNDWEAIRLTRTADGIYIIGAPTDAVKPTLFGLPVVVTTHQTQNTGIVGAWRMHSELALRRGVEVQISNSHGDYFIQGRQAIRADIRAAFILNRASAFCKVTGI